MSRLTPGPCWRVSAPTDHEEFIRRLHDLLPPRSVLYLEGGSPDRAILEFMHARACEPQLKLALGTIWPRPQVFHIPATVENLTDLAAVFGNHATPEICIHFHAYCEQTVVLQWHDAFFDDPLYLCPSFRNRESRRSVRRVPVRTSWIRLARSRR